MMILAEYEYTFSQEDFDSFARLSGDSNPIHIDPTFAAKSGFGKTVAHGIFLYSILYENLSKLIQGRKVTSSKIQFPAPTFTMTPMIFDIKQNSENEYLLRSREKSNGKETCIVEISLENCENQFASYSTQITGLECGRLKIGQVSKTQRAFSLLDMQLYRSAFAIENEIKSVPNPLINAVFSKVLGIEMPGLGTNYLKQETQYYSQGKIGEVLEFEVKIIRLRPDKKLVDLLVVCVDSSGNKIANGRALVSARDVAGAFNS